MTTISIRATDGRTASVEALEVPFTRGTFATHRSFTDCAPGDHHESLFWTATHVPSGLHVPEALECWTRQHAEFLAQLLYLLLVEAGIDPRRTDLRAEVARHGEAFAEGLRQRLSALADALYPDDDDADIGEFDPETVDDPDEVSR